MSKKEIGDEIDFERILEELEKIPFQAKKQTLATQFKTMKEESIVQAKEDIDAIFYKAVEKNVETLNGVPTPLTKEESKAFDDKYDEAVAKINLIKKKIAFAKKLLKEKIKKENGFVLDLENRGTTKKAAKRFFKEKKDVITYEDYLVAREYRNSQNEKEVESFMEEDEEKETEDFVNNEDYE